MAAKPKKAAKPVDPRIEAGPTPVPASVNDTREDSAAVLGQFVDVVSGEHEGRYGVFDELGNDGKTAVVRTRDSDSIRIVCQVSDLVPAQAGRR